MAKLPLLDQFPVGFRFNPTDEQLLHHYLKNKVSGDESLVEYIPQIDLCEREPWDIAGKLSNHTGIDEWFFFSALDVKYPKSHRFNRATEFGFWKSTGKDRKIVARGTKKQIGTKKTLVYRIGRVPNEAMTNWVIHEYHLHPDTNFADQRPFVICRLKKNSDVSKFDDLNGLMSSTFGNDLKSPGQPALPDWKLTNASDSGANRQSTPPEPESELMRPSEKEKLKFGIIELQSDTGSRDASDYEAIGWQYGEENEIYPSEELRSSSDNYLLQAGRVSRDTSDDETFVGQHIRPRISPTGKRFQYKEENEINPAQELQSSFDETLSVIILFFFLFFLFLCFSFFVFMSIRASLNVLRLILRDNRLALLIITLLLFQPLIVIVK